MLFAHSFAWKTGRENGKYKNKMCAWVYMYFFSKKSADSEGMMHIFCKFVLQAT